MAFNHKIYDASGKSNAEIIGDAAPTRVIYGLTAVGLAAGSTIELRVGATWAGGTTMFTWEVSAAEVGCLQVKLPPGTEFIAGNGTKLFANSTGDWLINTYTQGN